MGNVEENSYDPGDCQTLEKWDYIATFDTLGSNVCPDYHKGNYGSHYYESFSGKIQLVQKLAILPMRNVEFVIKHEGIQQFQH